MFWVPGKPGREASKEERLLSDHLEAEDHPVHAQPSPRLMNQGHGRKGQFSVESFGRKWHHSPR